MAQELNIFTKADEAQRDFMAEAREIVERKRREGANIIRVLAPDGFVHFYTAPPRSNHPCMLERLGDSAVEMVAESLRRGHTYDD